MSIEAASSDAWRRYVHAPFGKRKPLEKINYSPNFYNK